MTSFKARIVVPLFALILAGAGFAGTCFAQVPGQATTPAKRTVLQQADVDGSAPQQTILGKVEIAPGSGNPFHTHYGTEMGYVLAGHIRLEIKGQPPRDLGPGESFLVPRGAVHRSVLVGDEPVNLISTWTVDKEKPLLTPAP
jgi:quercetin dioxygenase-like cupin family protein